MIVNQSICIAPRRVATQVDTCMPRICSLEIDPWLIVACHQVLARDQNRRKRAGPLLAAKLIQVINSGSMQASLSRNGIAPLSTSIEK